MENKYYTPNIEDLKVQYICEEKILFTEWCKTTLGTGEFIGKIAHKAHWENNDSLDGLIRTKFLDKEDIESLGFKYIGLTKEKEWYPEIQTFSKDWTDCPPPCHMSDYDYGKYILTFDVNEGPTWQNIKIKIFKQTFGGFSGGGEPEKMIFEGTCPSINELKCLMKLLKL